ncbi:MAG: FxLYD domain-containing protein [Synergistaceae bacterium]|nr:FxLYD domain-containing protein [Synergistaceae bacterium]MBP9958517.1 FxLYD domain-containing protein [Synergistaceae bacterium]
MSDEKRSPESLRHKRLFIFFVSLLSLALSFGAGVAVGKKSLIQPEISRSSIVSSDLSAKGSIKKENDVKIAENTPQEPPSLILVSQEMGEDEEGLFIYGTVKNVSGSDYDVVQVEFDLCDNQERPYHVVKEKTTEGLRNNDSWGFTLYVPYTEREKFASYHLRSLSGARMNK